MRTDTYRWARAALAALALSCVVADPGYGQSAEDVRQMLREAATTHGVSGDHLIRVVSCETGGQFNADAVGDGGRSHGIAQLHERGLLPLFYSHGYSSPYNAREAAAFIAWAFTNGLASHWSCR